MEAIRIITNVFSLYYTNKITREERKTALKKHISQDLFNIAISSLANVETLEVTRQVILTGFLLDYYNESNEIQMGELLLQNFHDSHEDIVSLFQSLWNNNTHNILVLVEALNRIPEYLQPEDFKYPYVRKIIYAIGAQPQPESLLASEGLAARTDDTAVKELALHQLEKRRRLGRWEYEKNKQQ